MTLKQFLADEARFKFSDFEIQEYMKLPLYGYIYCHEPVGSFLMAVICNDLYRAVTSADENNLRNLPAYVHFFYNYAPASCWGSLKLYDYWLGSKPDISVY